MADLGIGSAAGNEMTMRAGAGDLVGAGQTFHGALRVSTVAGALTVLVGVAFAVLSYVWHVPGTPTIGQDEAVLVLIGLALAVALGFTSGVFAAGFRCCERNALGIMLTNMARLADVVLSAAILMAGQGPAAVCLGLVSTRVALLVVQCIWLPNIGPWLFTPNVQADKNIVRRLFLPAIGFLAFPVGNALALQGPILIIGLVFGGPAVAMFSALRTLARIPIQITSLFNASVWPELSRAFGSGQNTLVREIHRISWGATFILILAAASALVILGRWISHLWLGDLNVFNPFIFAMLLTLTVISALWNASAVVLVATNAHVRFSGIFVATNAVFLAMAAVLAPHWGLPAIMNCLLATEVVLFVWVLRAVLLLTEDDLGDFLRRAPLAGVRLVISRAAQILPN